MEKSIKNNSSENINQLNYDILSNKILDYYNTDKYPCSIYIKNFKLSFFWEIYRIKQPIMLFISDTISKNNLTKKLETDKNLFIYPQDTDIYLKNYKNINFNQNFNYDDFHNLLYFFKKKNLKQVILFDAKESNLNILEKLNIPILSYLKTTNTTFIPRIITKTNVILFLKKRNIEVYYVGKSFDCKQHFEYLFLDTKKISENFFKLNNSDINSLLDSVKKTFIQKLRNTPIKNTTPKISIPKNNFEYIENNKIPIITRSPKNNRILSKNYKKYIEKINNIEYPNKDTILKINFIIKDNSIINLTNIDNQIIYMEYQLMFYLTNNYLVYYNSVLLNDKIDKNNKINLNKFMKEFKYLKKNNFLYDKSIIKCPKDKFDLIFFTGDSPKDLELYDCLPYPKILSGIISPDIWMDDRHIISFPSKKYLDIISSGILKDSNNNIINLPKRYIIKRKFIGPDFSNRINLKTELYADYLILIETNNINSVEISLLENIIEKMRIEYQKEIYLFIKSDKKTNKTKYIRYINNYYELINNFDLIIVLDDIWENKYELNFTILQAIFYQIPLLMAKNHILKEEFNNYPGLFEGLNQNIIGINEVKNFFETKLKNLLSDEMEENLYLEFKKQTWNKKVHNYYSEYFKNIINFLKTKNYQRSSISFNNDNGGFNFYYYEILTSVNLSHIYQNLESFLKLISEFKNILLISSDYPGYGGAATQNNDIANMLRLQGHTCKELYYLFDSVNDNDANNIINQFKKQINKYDFESLLIENEEDFFYNNIRVCKVKDLENNLEKLDREFKPDLIILKNHLNGKIIPDKYNCKIYYLIAGIYQNTLNKFYYNLNFKENEMYLNKAVIETLKDKRIKPIVNSVHTKKILENNCNIKTDIYYSNFINYYPHKLPQINLENLNKREYDYGIICSDFTRPIKNIFNICNDLSHQIKKTDKIIFIGKNSKKFKKLFKNQKQLTCIDLIPNYLIPDYLKKIKNILINSYYESSSNLAIQAKFNGCNVIRKPLSKDNNKIKILITSTQKPGNGGSATNAYKLTKWLRKFNYPVAVLFYNKEQADKINIDNIEGFFTIRDVLTLRDFHSNSDKIIVRNKIINYLGGYPSMIFAFNYYAPILSRKLFPNSYLYYFVVGNPVLSIGEDSIINQETSVQKFLKDDYVLTNYDELTYSLELETIKISDEIIFDQGILNLHTISKVHPLFRYLYNTYYNYGINILMAEIKPLDKIKEFELVIISSNWKRLVKNPKLAYMIFKEFPQYRKLVIGDNSDIFNKITNTTCLPLLPYKQTQDYIAKSKLLLITSFSETGPNTMIEAFLNKCQVLSSKNIGYQRYLKEYQLCEDVYNLDEWKNKIKYIIDNILYLPFPKFQVEEDKEKFINFINHRKISYMPNVLVVCGDKPYYGGAATNSYNLIKLLLEKKFRVNGLFISYQKEGIDDPDNLGCVEHLFLNESIQDKLYKWKETYNNFDIIFCKNYKVFTLIKLTFPYIPIIYSPSGLRQVTAEISKRKQFYHEMKDEQINLIDSNHKLIPDDNWFNFIMKNDKHLENYALINADYLLPNSQITYDIIKNYYNNISNKLLEPVYLTNIQYIEQINFNFRKRKYDFAFIATNWKRATKNIWLVKSIIKKFKDSNYNILVIGSNHNITETNFPKKDYPNLYVKNHVLRTEMITIYQNIKSIVITSFYESNPNVMIEAIYCGCNVVASDNVGNSENLRNQLLIRSPYKINDWVNAIETSTKKLFPYLGPTLITAKEQFISLISNLGCKQEAIGIYKINAKWDNENLEKNERVDKIDFTWIEIDQLKNFEEHIGRKTDIFSNIYLHLFSKLTEKLNFKFSHYLFIDETLQKSYRTKWNNINIWILRSKEEILYFNQAKFYFVRGNYPNFYQKLIPSNAYSIYYPATSFKYDFNIKKNESIIKRDLINYFNKKNHPQYKKYNLILCHEDKNYQQQFDKSKLVMFKKFSVNKTFKYLNLIKEYDIIFVAQAVQKSKNHQLFFDFIKYCDENDLNINIAYVSNREYLEKNYSNFYLPKDEGKTKVIFFNHLNPEKLCELYNKSKINLVLSHRDCVPRVIVESIVCGCYNVGTDLLSDGKYYYDGVCGELLNFDYAEVEIINSGMISYKSNPLIFKKLYNVTQKNYNYKKISKHGVKLYNIENTINSIMKKIR